LLISSDLVSLLENASFDIRQKLQNLLFPKGVKYHKQEHRYLTIKENNVFTVFSKLSAIYKSEETKKEPQICDSFNLVAQEIIHDYADVESLELARRYGCSLFTLRNLVHRYGLKKSRELIASKAKERMENNPNLPARAAGKRKRHLCEIPQRYTVSYSGQRGIRSSNQSIKKQWKRMKSPLITD
jgi:hypothetical protein